MTPRLLRAGRAAALALAAAPAAPALAQSPGSFLPGAEAGRAAPAALAPDTPAPPAPLTPGPAGAGVTLRGVRLEGASAVPPGELAPLWSGLIGTEVTLATLNELAEAIGAAYRARGFVLSQAVLPPQTVADGVVAIRVVEGFIADVTVTGGAPNQNAAAATLFAPVPADRPLRIETLERAVLLSRDFLGGEVETLLEPAADTFGAADLTVAVAQNPFDGFVSVDNRGSRLYGEASFATGATAYNLLGLNEKLDFLAAGAFDSSLGFVQGGIAIPLLGLAGTWADGATLELEADYADGAPDLAQSGAPDAQTLTTEETNLRLALSVPFLRTRAQNLRLDLGLEWQDSSNVTGLGADEVTEDDRLLVLDAHLAWDRADRWGGVSLVEAGLRQGIDASDTFVGGGVSNGVPDFTLMTLELARLQRLGQGPWALWLEGMGQYALDILPNSERFGLGDATIGRGYAPGNTTGDSGYGGRAELRYGVDPARLAGFAEGAELYAFGDYGRAYDRDGERDGRRWETLASAGAGVRLDVRPWLTIIPEIARQLDGQATDTTDRHKETRLYLSVVARF
ncbi:ShlB/FhaC/HecB family hemolysin secretion/activation protein [Amaricoccus sp.]|uniref:ShlB/FhaC/HecB family hemolysin secretion/activation protein n=1 Tax=Amaricoccus sp. TaxID=1872485 RepID=UPI001B7132A9|nr:POTRA domain-containing protein [Amaricoccus sp.]MBP7003750.1 ShlB/FhaC/HecB family hemolysin secretion/activation protein [Amaricoccus sp.]